MKILLISPEVVPFAKTGGLADVAGSLPKALKTLGLDIRILMPLYRMARDTGKSFKEVSTSVPIPVGKQKVRVNFYESTLDGDVPVYFVEKNQFFDRRYLYGTPKGDYRDNAKRFILLCRSAFELCKQLDFKPDVFHCNDWQSGLVPVYLKTVYHGDPFFLNTACLFTIHNVAYQGIFEKEAFELTGLPWEIFNPSGIEYWGKFNFMKGGIYYSEVISTVSKKYSEEIQTPEFGYGLDGVLRDRTQDVHGVVNGVDYRQWSPETDPHIPARYGPGDLSGKRACKEALLNDLGMDAGLVNAPLLGAISRLADQKGFDLLAEIMGDLMSLDVGFVLLGTGEQKYHSLFEGIANKYPGKTGIRIAYDNALAHGIEAGCDIFLMPSRYEPCGLNQIYSLKYGTIPVVRATGGLDDTIEDYDAAPDGGTGFKFYPYSGEEFLRAIKRALKVFQDDKAWTQLILRGMAKDFSWESSALHYRSLYEKAMGKKGPTETL